MNRSMDAMGHHHGANTPGLQYTSNGGRTLDLPAAPPATHHQHHISSPQGPLSGGSASCAMVAVPAAPKNHLVAFNDFVPTNCRIHNREDASKPLGVLVASGYGGPSGHSNLVKIRLTDPTDPFFVFQLDLLEDDYGRFKKEHQLHVDFSEFASMLANMLQSVVEQQGSPSGASLLSSSHVPVPLTMNSGSGDWKLYFEVGGATSTSTSSSACGQLFVQEVTRLKTTNVIVLQLLRENDVGQKKYLAEQFEYFQVSFLESDAQRKEHVGSLERSISETRRALERAEMERDDLCSKLRVDATESDAKHQKILLDRQEQHALELRSLRVAATDEQTRLQQRLDALQSTLRELEATKDKEIHDLQTRVAALENTEVTLRGQLDLKNLTLENQKQELELLHTQVQQLQDHRSGTQRTLNETGLQAVQLTERLAAAERNAAERAEETRILRLQAGNDAETIRVLTEQLKERQSKLLEADADLKKAHHIIANQLQASKQHKERFAGVVQQLQDARFMLDQLQSKKLEGDAALERSQDEYRRSQDAVQTLKEQIQALLDSNSKLEQDLKLARDAVVHVQRHGSHALTRHLSSVSGVHGMAPAADLYRQFAMNSTVHPGGASQGPSSVGGPASMPPSSRDYGGLGTTNYASQPMSSSLAAGYTGTRATLPNPSRMSVAAQPPAQETPSGYF